MSEIKPNDSAITKDRREKKDLSAAKALDNRPKPESAITIVVSPCALFNMVAERKIYEEEGLEKYVAHQVEHKDDPLKPGAAFPFVKALMNVNSRLRKLYPDSEELFDIVLMTDDLDHAQAGVRLKNSIEHYGGLATIKNSTQSSLTRDGFSMTEGNSEGNKRRKCLNVTNLYLSTDSEKVKDAIKKGIAAATVFTLETETELSETQLRVAFDGDGVLFSDESETITQTKGLAAFYENEKKLENEPLSQGPLKCFLEALGKLQKKFCTKNELKDCPIRTFLVTARSAASPGTRVLKTLRSWDLEINEAFFLSGAPKGPHLQIIKPHIFFDDQMRHIEGAKELGTISAHVPYGITQEKLTTRGNS